GFGRRDLESAAGDTFRNIAYDAGIHGIVDRPDGKAAMHQKQYLLAVIQLVAKPDAKGARNLPRGVGKVGGFLDDARVNLLAHRIDDRVEEFVLVGKMIIEGAFGDLGFSDDLVDRDRAYRAFGDQVLAGVNQGLAGSIA